MLKNVTPAMYEIKVSQVLLPLTQATIANQGLTNPLIIYHYSYLP